MIHERLISGTGKMIRLVAVILMMSTLSVYAQKNGSISGKVTDAAGQPLPFASVTIDTLKTGVVCDEHGIYKLTRLPAGSFRVSAVVVGYKKNNALVTVREGQNLTMNFSLEEDVLGLNEVTVVGEKDQVVKVREQAYTVTSIDVVPMQNLNIDVNTVLNRTTGVRIRQSGGLGSDFNFSLNGFTGNQVRFFIDGIPADYLGSTMRFNNIPVNVIERIEVYKGVVPIHLGADALGGAVNIVTSDNAKDFLDVSYSVGSFNTHQAAVASRLTVKENFVVNASAFYNYSDNNYNVLAPVIDNVGNILGEKHFKLFNEGYESKAAMFEGGVVRTKWADRLLIGLIASDNEKHYQRGQSMAVRPMGQVYSTDHTFIPTLKYSKKDLGVKNLSLNLAAIYSHTNTVNVDTSSREYKWDGSYTVRKVGTLAGEFSYYKSKFQFRDRATFNSLTLEYKLGDHHTFALNNAYSWFTRKGSDPIASQYDDNIAFSDPVTLTKNITGMSYKLGLWDNRWSTTVFVKLFYMNAGIQIEDEDTGEFHAKTNKKTKVGEGIASTFFLTKRLQLKTSYEYTTRLPESDEFFGNGLTLLPNMEIQPEVSHNFNFNVLYNKRINDNHSIDAEGGFIYRVPNDVIRLEARGAKAVHQNMPSSKVAGVEGAVRYGYKRLLNLELNATFQDIRNNSSEITTYDDPLKNDRFPNIPYLFGNAIVGITSSEFTESKLRVGFNWATMYVEKFYLMWPSQGQEKHWIPRQISHDASATLSGFSGKYNLSFSCWNLTDSNLYDNYKVQKPGRSFNVKLRVYIDRFRN